VIRLLALAVWLVLVTTGAGYGVTLWRTAARDGAATSHARPKLQTVVTRRIGVPILAGGKVQGYVVAKFSFAADAAGLKEAPVKPDDFVLDEAFRAIYETSSIDFANLQRQDLDELRRTIVARVNARLAVDLVKDLLIEDLNYLPGHEARGRKAP
jgi:hypothetical protein